MFVIFRDLLYDPLKQNFELYILIVKSFGTHLEIYLGSHKTTNMVTFTNTTIDLKLKVILRARVSHTHGPFGDDLVPTVTTDRQSWDGQNYKNLLFITKW